MGDIAQRGNKLTKGPHGHGPKPFLNRPGQAQGTHGGKATGGRVGKFGGGRTRLLEELGRVEAEPSNRNRRAEIARVHGELNRGYAVGGVVKGGIKAGKRFLDFIKTGKHVDKKGVKTNVPKAAERLTGKPHVDRVKKAAGGWTRVKPTRSRLHEVLGGGEKGKPHSTPEGRQAAGKRLDKRFRKKALDDMHDEAWAGKDAEKGKPHSSKEGRIAGGRQNFKRWAKKAWGAKKGGKADKKWIQKAVNPKHKGFCTPMTKKTCTPRRKALARTFKKKAKTGW